MPITKRWRIPRRRQRECRKACTVKACTQSVDTGDDHDGITARTAGGAWRRPRHHRCGDHLRRKSLGGSRQRNERISSAHPTALPRNGTRIRRSAMLSARPQARRRPPDRRRLRRLWSARARGHRTAGTARRLNIHPVPRTIQPHARRAASPRHVSHPMAAGTAQSGAAEGNHTHHRRHRYRPNPTNASSPWRRHAS